MKVSLLKSQVVPMLGLDMITFTEPLGLECIAGGLEAEGHECQIVDFRINSRAKGLDNVIKYHPQVIGIQCNFTTERYRAIELARLVKGHIPDSLVVIGGHDASRDPEWFQAQDIDAVVIGDGEEVMPDLVTAVEKCADLRTVPGLMINNPGGAVFTAAADQRANIDELPLPARHLIRQYAGRYYMSYLRPVALLETARGCPYRCNFCSVWKFHKGRYRQKSPERVVRELSAIDVPNVFITDDIFWMDRKRGEELAQAIKQAGIRKHFLLQTRTDVIVHSPEVVERWKECGELTIFLGLEKIDDAGLKLVNKNNTMANNHRAIAILKDMEVAYTASFIVDPAWDHDDFARLRKWIERTGSYNSGFSILTPLPGTDLWDEMQEQVTTHDWELFDLEHAVIPTKLSLDDFYEEYSNLWRHTLSVRYKSNGKWRSNMKLLHALATRAVTISALRKGISVGRVLSDPSVFIKSHRDSENKSVCPNLRE